MGESPPLTAFGGVDQADRNIRLASGPRRPYLPIHGSRGIDSRPNLKEVVMATKGNRGFAPNIDIGIPTESRQQIAEGLSRLLADTYTLYLKTHNYHWNVTGPMFNTLHLMFEAQYTELATAVDLIAERIRALGFPAPGTYKDYSRLSSIAEVDGVPSADEMIADLVKGQEAVVRTARATFPTVEKASDEASADLLTQRMQLHEKNAWMLRSLLEQ
jgi:starvation-inducible DNA-binding protein